MKTWDHWSASQIETFRMCNRKWWWNYIFGVPKEDTVDTVLGKQVHAEIEYYLTTGDASKLGEIARPALAAGHLPKPGTVEIEVPIGIDKRAGVATGEPLITLAGMPGEGYIDVRDGTEVWDHKTTGDLKYAKTVEELRSNVQMIIYAEASRRLHRQRFGAELTKVRVGHIVYLKRFPFGTRKTPCDLSIRDITEGMAAAEETVKQMKSLSTEKNPDRVPPTWSACSAYRGCQHRERCDALRRVSGQASTAFAGISGADIETPLSEKKMNPLLDKLKKGAGGAAPAKPETKAAAAPAKEVAVPAGDPKSALLAKLKGGGGAVTQEKPKGVNPPDASDGKAAAANPITQKLQARAADASAEKTARKPRNYEERLGALNWTGAQIGKMSAETMHKILDGSIDQAGGAYSILNDGTLYEIPEKEEEAEIDLNSNEAVEMGASLGWEESDIDAFADEVFERILKEKIRKDDVEDVVMGGRGNKKIVDLKVKPPPPPPVAAKKTAPEKVVATPQETGDTLALFIDCYPVKGFTDQVIDLAEYLAPLQQKVATLNKVEHYSLTDGGFGRGRDMVAALVALAPPKGVFVVDTRLPCTMAVLEVLRVHADIIVQGRW